VRPQVPAPDWNTPLVQAVQRELTEAGRVNTVAAQIALELAARIGTDGSPGLARLSRTLRETMASALIF
jgi:hypothetical protein